MLLLVAVLLVLSNPALLDRLAQQGREETGRMRPLPAQPYEYAEWRKAKPGIDYHISVNKRFYSVPHALVARCWTFA
jgi:hypothetical protein